MRLSARTENVSDESELFQQEAFFAQTAKQKSLNVEKSEKLKVSKLLVMKSVLLCSPFFVRIISSMLLAYALSYAEASSRRVSIKNNDN